jgi:hypothetical protein
MTLNGEEGEDQFALEGVWDDYANTKVAIQGKWLCDLPWSLFTQP